MKFPSPTRHYEASLGRWFAIDPHAENYLNISPYTYALDNPIYFIDPDGKDVYGMSIEAMQNMYGSNNVQIITYNRSSENPIKEWFDKVITDPETAERVANNAEDYAEGGYYRVIQLFEDGELTNGKALFITLGSIGYNQKLSKLPPVNQGVVPLLRKRIVESGNRVKKTDQEHHLNVEAITRNDSNAPDDVKKLFKLGESAGYNNDSHTIMLESYSLKGGYGIHSSHYWYNQYNYKGLQVLINDAGGIKYITPNAAKALLEYSAGRMKNLIQTHVLDAGVAEKPFQNLNSVFRELHNNKYGK